METGFVVGFMTGRFVWGGVVVSTLPPFLDWSFGVAVTGRLGGDGEGELVGDVFCCVVLSGEKEFLSLKDTSVQ